METIIFLISNKEDGLASLNFLCDGIKSREDANHKLFFSRRLMGTYIVTNRETRQIIFCPLGRIEDIKSGLNIVDTYNCMWFVGDTEKSQSKLMALIDWLLGNVDTLEERLYS